MVSAAIFAVAAVASASAASKDVLARVVEAYEGRLFRLAIDLHASEPGGHPAPSLDEKGWRHNDTNRPIVLRAGDEVEVTGVYNYGEAGVFLEISRKEKWTGGPPRPRVRVRFTTSEPPDDPEKQISQIQGFIRRVLRDFPP